MNKNTQKIKRKTRIRKKIFGTKEMPRLSVYRSNKFIYAQIINDEEGKTILGLSEKQLTQAEKGDKKSVSARKLGTLLASQAKAKKISKVVFDKGAYAFHGRIKELAEGAREGGLIF